MGGQRLPVRLYNAVQRGLEWLGRTPPSFVGSEAALRAAAQKAAGASDFGDPAYEEGLRVLLHAYDREARLNPFGRMMVQAELTGILRNRLAVERALAEQPAIRGQEIRRPIFILGLPRTGTTALHHLLAQDPGNQVLEFWLAAAPAARPPRAEWEANPRFQEAVRGLKMMYFLDPSLKAIHLMTADGPEECRHLLQQSFTDDTFECNATIPSYSAWYAAKDMRATYARHRDVLKLVGSPTPDRRWVLKYPAHLRHLPELLAVYPDACIVQTHRDPGRMLPSLCSLIAGWRGIYEDDPDRHAIGRWQLDLWSGTMERALAERRHHDPRQFYDIHFREIVADPIGAVRRMYAHFGGPLSEDAERRMRAWHQANPQGKHGEHRYSAEEFGLTDAMMAERFAPYLEHFQIPRERAA
ncbi:MAG: sulfotransferase [Candidatus Binatia bacterium]